MKRIGTLLMALAIALGPAHAAAAEADAAALKTLLDEFLAAASVNDAAMHERFWSDDLIYTSSSGQRFGKPQILKSLAAADPAAAATAYRAEDVIVQQRGTIAVVTFRLIAEEPDEPRSEYFNTGVFQQEDGQWRAFVWQATRAADPDGV